MPFQQRAAIRYYTFESLDDSGLLQAVFTRQGGVSPQPWCSLNLGGGLGDDAACVKENKRRALLALDRTPESVYDVWQVHGAEVICATQPRRTDQAQPRADAILTDRPAVTLLMRFADCVPIVLFDPLRRVIGLAHAGWQGTVRRTAAAAVQKMRQVYGSRAEDIHAAIGPSIAAHHYQVGEEVVEQARAAFGCDAESLLPGDHGAVQFDLWAANQLVLEQAGVRRIELCGICTACQTDDWFSHRGENGHTGRFGLALALKER